MNDLRAAAQQALEFAADIVRGKYKGNAEEMRDALRAALAQQEQEPLSDEELKACSPPMRCVCRQDGLTSPAPLRHSTRHKGEDMTDLRQATQQALEKVADALPAYIDGVAAREYLAVIHKALKQQQAEPVQEPVQHEYEVTANDDGTFSVELPDGEELRIIPPRREWRGLSEPCATATSGVLVMPLAQPAPSSKLARRRTNDPNHVPALRGAQRDH